MGLLIPLIAFARNTTLALGIHSYLNVMSVAVSSIVLLDVMLSDTHQKQIAAMQEMRTQEDQTHVTNSHTPVLGTLANQHQEIDDLKQMSAATQGQAYERKPRQVVADLPKMHPGGDGPLSVGRRESPHEAPAPHVDGKDEIRPLVVPTLPASGKRNLASNVDLRRRSDLP